MCLFFINQFPLDVLKILENVPSHNHDFYLQVFNERRRRPQRPRRRRMLRLRPKRPKRKLKPMRKMILMPTGVKSGVMKMMSRMKMSKQLLLGECS